MRRLFTTIAACALVMGSVGVGSMRAFAEETKAAPSIIATVDMQKALQTVDAGKKAKAQLEKEFNAKKKGLQDEEAAIRKLADEFKKQSLVLNDDARAKKQSEIQERAMKFQENMQRSQTEIQQKEAELTAPIVKSLSELVKEIATKKGYNMVLDKSANNVLFSEDKDDLTSDLVTQYNSKHKS